MKELREKPFALIGVNVLSHKPGGLKEVMAKEKLNWRSFDDEGEIHRQWNSPATPTFFIIDHEGTIRRKWVGHPGKEPIDHALEKLIKEVEAVSKSQ